MKAVESDVHGVPIKACFEDVADNNDELCEQLATIHESLNRPGNLKEKCNIETDLSGELWGNFPYEYVFFHKEGELYFCFTLAELQTIVNTAGEKKPPYNKIKNPYTTIPFPNEGEIRKWIKDREDLFDEEKIEPIVESTSDRYLRMFNDLFAKLPEPRPSWETFMKNYSVDYTAPTLQNLYPPQPNPTNMDNKQLIYDLLTILTNTYLDTRYYINVPHRLMENIRLPGNSNPYYTFIELITMGSSVPVPIVEPAPPPIVEPAPPPIVEPAPAPVIEPAPPPIVEPVREHGMSYEDQLILSYYINKDKERMQELKRLIIKRQDLTPEYLSSIMQENTVDLTDKDLTSLPESFGGLSNLKILHLAHNNLSDLPESFGELFNLQQLTLTSNRMTKLPESFGNLSALSALLLNYNNLTTLPESFGRLSSLTELNLNGNQLTTLPKSFGRLSSLTKLNLYGNQLTTLPESFGNLRLLSTLILKNNRLIELPKSFGGLSNLAVLHLSDNKLTTLPESFGNLSMLEDLFLLNNRLAKLPESFGGLSRLTDLNLDGNRLIKLPESFGGLSNLQTVNLGHNQLTTLPKSIGNLSMLEDLFLRGNMLGILPESIGGLSRLTGLTLSNNRLVKLPKSIEMLSHLTELDLDDNEIPQDEINRIHTVLGIPLFDL
jgi:Leucine-rich repeat (LRR) protein